MLGAPLPRLQAGHVFRQSFERGQHQCPGQLRRAVFRGAPAGVADRDTSGLQGGHVQRLIAGAREHHQFQSRQPGHEFGIQGRAVAHQDQRLDVLQGLEQGISTQRLVVHLKATLGSHPVPLRQSRESLFVIIEHHDLRQRVRHPFIPLGLFNRSG